MVEGDKTFAEKSTVSFTDESGENVEMSLNQFEERLKEMKENLEAEAQKSWVTKVKLVDGEDVKIWTENHVNENDTVISCFKSKDQPHYEFIDAMRNLDEHARIILEVPFDWAEELTITSVTFSRHEKTGVRGATMAGIAKLESAGSPFTFSTPHLPFDQIKESGEDKLMPTITQMALLFVENEAVRFVKGRRAQGDLFEAA